MLEVVSSWFQAENTSPQVLKRQFNLDWDIMMKKVTF